MVEQSLAQTEEAVALAQELQDSLDLYQQTFGEVFAGVEPIYPVNDSQPPSWGSPAPLFAAPFRNYNLDNNPDAVNPTYHELENFLRADRTDSYRYIYYYYMCGNFAETVHNNAEAAGIRAAVVFIQYNYGDGHAIDAFVTTDRGLVYIDCTGASVQGPSSNDAIVNNLKMYSPYNPTFLFPSGYYYLPDSRWVTDLEIYW
jgi:hypothetical protein